MDIVAFISVFCVGFAVGFGVAKLITRESQSLLRLKARELELEKELLESKNKALESSLASARELGSEEEQSYKQIIESLQTACASKDREIKSLEKRINAFRFSR